MLNLHSVGPIYNFSRKTIFSSDQSEQGESENKYNYFIFNKKTKVWGKEKNSIVKTNKNP